MAATTQGAIVGRFSGATLAAAFTNSLHLDLIQVIKEGGAVAYNVNYLGVAASNPASPTRQGGASGKPIALIGQYEGQTLALAFYNPSHLDLLQVIKPNDGDVVFYVDYLGTAH